MSGGLSYAVLRAALHRRSTLPPPQHKAYTASFNSSPPSPLYPSFALLRTRIYYGRWRRFCLPSAKYSPSLHGRGFCISSLQLRLRFGSSLRGWHRFSASSSAVVHTSLRSGSLLPSTLPFTHARGTKKRRRNLSEPFPQAPSRHNKREREQVACAGVTANSSSSSRCSLRSRLSLSASVLPNQRIRMERRHRRFLQHSVGVNRPGAFCPGSDHASLLPIVCHCRGSSNRTQVPGTVAAGERSKRCFSVERPLAGLVKKKNEERRYSPSFASITADPSDKIPLCIVVRYASTARFAARPSGST